VKSLKDERSYVRKYAADALGDLRDPRAADALREATFDSSEEVRSAAKKALAAFP